MKRYIQSYSYFDYNANPRGTTTGDCQTRAIATAFGWTWQEARKLLRKFGNDWYNHAVNVERVLEHELKCQVIPVDTMGKPYITVGDFCDNQGADGTYLILCSKPTEDSGYGTHLVCTINGTIYDTWNSSWYKVVRIYKPTGTYRTEGFAETSDIPEHIHELAQYVRDLFKSRLEHSDLADRIMRKLPASATCECVFMLSVVSVHSFNIAVQVKVGVDIKGTSTLWHKVKKKFNLSFDETDMYADVVEALPTEIDDMLYKWYDTLALDVVDRFNASALESSNLRRVPKSQTLIKAYSKIDPDLKPYVLNMETFCGYTCATVQIDDDMNILVMCKSAKDLSNSIRICRKYDKAFWKDYDTKRINITPYGFTIRLDHYIDTYSGDKYDFQQFYEDYKEYEDQANLPSAEPLDYFFYGTCPKVLT